MKVTRKDSSDANVSKYVFDFQNAVAEAVLYKYPLFNPFIWEATISVICEREESVAAANARQRDLAAGFQAKLIERGFSTRMFDPAGQDDIGGGCGQLWYVQEWMRTHPDLARPSVGHGRPEVHTPKVAA